jgi:hypothetical protein
MLLRQTLFFLTLTLCLSAEQNFYFLKIDGYPGSSDDPVYDARAGWHRIDHLQLRIERPDGAASARPDALVFRTESGLFVPLLFEAVATQSLIPLVTIIGVERGEGPNDFESTEIELSVVTAARLDLTAATGSRSDPLEGLDISAEGALVFERLRWTERRQKPDGSVGESQSVDLNFAVGK